MSIRPESSIRGFLFQKKISLNKDNWKNFVTLNVLGGIGYIDLRNFGGNIYYGDDTALLNVEIILGYNIIKENTGITTVNDMSMYASDFLGKTIVLRRKSTTTKPFKIIRQGVDIAKKEVFSYFFRSEIIDVSGYSYITWNIIKGVGKDGEIIE